VSNAFPCETSCYSCNQNECFENWFFETLRLGPETFLTNKTSLHIFERRFSITLKLIFQTFVTNQMSLHIFKRQFSITLKLIFQTFVTIQMSLHIFHQNQNQKFSSLLKTSPWESLEFLQNEFALNKHQNHFCVWNNFEIPKILHENNSL